MSSVTGSAPAPWSPAHSSDHQLPHAPIRPRAGPPVPRAHRGRAPAGRSLASPHRRSWAGLPVWWDRHRVALVPGHDQDAALEPWQHLLDRTMVACLEQLLDRAEAGKVTQGEACRRQHRHRLVRRGHVRRQPPLAFHLRQALGRCHRIRGQRRDEEAGVVAARLALRCEPPCPVAQARRVQPDAHAGQHRRQAPLPSEQGAAARLERERIGRPSDQQHARLLERLPAGGHHEAARLLRGHAHAFRPRRRRRPAPDRVHSRVGVRRSDPAAREHPEPPCEPHGARAALEIRLHAGNPVAHQRDGGCRPRPGNWVHRRNPSHFESGEMLRGRADNPQTVVPRLRNEHAARSDLAQNWSMDESPRTSPPRRGAPERGDASPASDPRRTLPRVDVLLAHPAVAARAAGWGRGPVLGAVRRVLDSARRAATAGEPVPGLDQLAAMVTGDLDGLAGQRMRAVINATGVVLHTNLGRAPLSQAAVAAITQAAGYSTVEYDLAAGALLLALGGLARDCEVVVSRGQLIEIGGEFRLPAIMQAAGVDLVEVGTTNRTHLADYERAIGERTACLLAVHPSNYQVVGFTTDPPLDAVADLAHQHGLPLLHDLGSGLVGDPFGDEPSVGQSLAAGADLVLFSGDKLLGGPQAGLLVGRQDLIQTLARNPLARAVRADKLTIAALEVTLASHAAGRRGELPVWRAL